MRWSPIITFESIYQEWYKSQPTVKLSKGGKNLIRAFSQFPIRLLEQALIDKYRPSLNRTGSVLFFNYNLEVEDFNRNLLSGDSIGLAFEGGRINYQAWDETGKILLAFWRRVPSKV